VEQFQNRPISKSIQITTTGSYELESNYRELSTSRVTLMSITTVGIRIESYSYIESCQCNFESQTTELKHGGYCRSYKAGYAYFENINQWRTSDSAICVSD